MSRIFRTIPDTAYCPKCSQLVLLNGGRFSWHGPSALGEPVCPTSGRPAPRNQKISIKPYPREARHIQL